MNTTGPRPFTRAIIIGLLVILAGIASYLVFARWPAGMAQGHSWTDFAIYTRAVSTPTVRIASYNIHSGYGADGKYDLDRIAGALKDFDLVGLQEVRGYFSGDTQASQLGSRLALNALFAPTERTRLHDEFGNAVLTRLPVDAWKRQPLPGTQSSGHRNVLIIQTTIGDKPLCVMVTHIDRVIDRKAQLEQLYDTFSKLPEPCVVMGDFNTPSDDPLLKPFLSNATDAVGIHRADRIDWIFTRGLVAKGGITDSNASDHPLVWADVSLPQ